MKNKLNFGCGGKLYDDYTNIDIDKSQGADIACDMNKFPYNFKSGSVDEIYCEMVLEHLDRPTLVINEFSRIIKKGGFVKIIVPHFSDCYSLSADIHIRKFGSLYFRDFKKRVLKSYEWDNFVDRNFSSVDVKIKFSRGILKPINYLIEKIVNINLTTQKIYEFYLSGIYRACEIEVIMIK